MRVETESKPSKKRGRSGSICGESSCGVAEGFRVVDVSAVSEARFHDKVGGEAGDVARVRYSR